MLTRFYSIFIFVFLLNIFCASVLPAQVSKNSIQFKLSGINFSSYERVKNHVEFESSVLLPISNQFKIRHEIGGYQYKHYWNPRSFEYRGTSYSARNGQLWRDISINSNFLFYFSENLYAGIGPGMNFIYVKRIIYTDWRTFWVNYNDEVIEVGKKKSKQTKVCFSSNIMVGWERTVWRNISFILEGKYKIILLGQELTGTDNSIIHSFSLLSGFEYNF
jgi:hypothetical protein